MIFQECKANSWEIKWNVLITASLFRNDVKFIEVWRLLILGEDEYWGATVFTIV